MSCSVPVKKAAYRTCSVVLVACLTLAFPVPADAARGFSDIIGHWAEAPVRTLVDSGVIEGQPDGTFRPNEPITRGAFLKLLLAAEGVQPQPGSHVVTGVRPGHWAKAWAETAAALGLLNPAEYGSFGIDQPMTKGESAVLMQRFLTWTASIPTRPAQRFVDHDRIPSSSAGAVYALRERGILTGYPDGTFGYGKTLTRAEAAVLLSRLAARNRYVISSEGLNVRSGPGLENRVISGLTFSQSVVFLDRAAQDPNWVKVRAGSVIGWVFAPYLSAQKPAPASTSGREPDQPPSSTAGSGSAGVPTGGEPSAGSKPPNGSANGGERPPQVCAPTRANSDGALRQNAILYQMEPSEDAATPSVGMMSAGEPVQILERQSTAGTDFVLVSNGCVQGWTFADWVVPTYSAPAFAKDWNSALRSGFDLIAIIEPGKPLAHYRTDIWVQSTPYAKGYADASFTVDFVKGDHSERLLAARGSELLNPEKTWLRYGGQVTPPAPGRLVITLWLKGADGHEIRQQVEAQVLYVGSILR